MFSSYGMYITGIRSAGGYSSMFASADCEDIKALPTGTMTKDVHLFLDDLDSLSCDEVRNGGAVPEL